MAETIHQVLFTEGTFHFSEMRNNGVCVKGKKYITPPGIQVEDVGRMLIVQFNLCL